MAAVVFGYKDDLMLTMCSCRWSEAHCQKKKCANNCRLPCDLYEKRIRAAPLWDGEHRPRCAPSPERWSHLPSASGTAGCCRFRADLLLTPGCQRQTWPSLEEHAANGEDVIGFCKREHTGEKMLIWISACQSETHDGPTQQILMQVVLLLMQRLIVLLIILCNLSISSISTYIINWHKANVYFRDWIHVKKTKTFLFGCVVISRQRIEVFTLEKAQFSGLVFSKWLQLEHTEFERFFNPELLVTYSKGVLVTC